MHLRELGATIGRPGEGVTSEAHPKYFVDLAEVIIPPRSQILGQSLAEAEFSLQVPPHGGCALARGLSFRSDVGAMPLEPGDTLLMVGAPAH